MPKASKEREEYIYERLGLKECLIISKTKKYVLVACNEDGNLVLKHIPVPQIEE